MDQSRSDSENWGGDDTQAQICSENRLKCGMFSFINTRFYAWFVYLFLSELVGLDDIDLGAGLFDRKVELGTVIGRYTKSTLDP